MSETPILIVDNISKSYGKKTVVNSVSFSVKPGEILGFIGPNGAGKSTTIKMITGLAKIDSGNVFICGYSIKTQFEKAIKNVGSIIEAPDLYKHLSGLDNLKFFARLYDNIGKNEIERVVNLVGLEKRIKDKVSKYSLGMKQRLGIAQSLLHYPKLVILDEPTNGLDATGVIEIRNFLKKLAKQENIAIVVSSHNLLELENLCDNYIIINNGKIIENKAIQQIKAEPVNPDGPNFYLKVGYPNFAGKLIKDNFNIKTKVGGNCVYIVYDEILMPKIFKLLVTNNIDIFGADKLQKSLESVFMDIVKKNNPDSKIS